MPEYLMNLYTLKLLKNYNNDSSKRFREVKKYSKEVKCTRLNFFDLSIADRIGFNYKWIQVQTHIRWELAQK